MLIRIYIHAVKDLERNVWNSNLKMHQLVHSENTTYESKHVTTDSYTCLVYRYM